MCVLSNWPIKKKLTLALALLLVLLAILSCSGIRGIYKYRNLARGVSRRALELPLAAEFAQRVSSMRMSAEQMRAHSELSPASALNQRMLRSDFEVFLRQTKETVHNYRQQFRKNQRIEDHEWRTDANQREGRTLHQIESCLSSLQRLCDEHCDREMDSVALQEVRRELSDLEKYSQELPSFLRQRMQGFKAEVQVEYRTAIVVIWATSALALLLLGVLVWLLQVWVLQPFHQILQGSRRVAAGDFGWRIRLATGDEMAELAAAMNNMTQRFQEIRDDLDRQVRERTEQVVRSEQLAYVGFLAAGVAHEINNPMASIALCAESLEERLHEVIQEDDARPDDAHNPEIDVVRNYLRMIQDEAFRCKQITDGLLDFSRIREVEPQSAELHELIQTVVEMVHHLGKSRGKTIQLRLASPVWAAVHPQEFKQVVLNLLTNALDSVNAGGTVSLALRQDEEHAEFIVRDDGCGMTDEVKADLFKPFFTRRREGQGTGLGLSISYRIVTEHGGTIHAYSAGPDQGSRFTVRLPLASVTPFKESHYQYEAA